MDNERAFGAVELQRVLRCDIRHVELVNDAVSCVAESQQDGRSIFESCGICVR
jgi:hypothetical protein